jgi:hypothetical protein
MLPPHLRKFSSLYAAFGLGAVKNIWLITCLIPLARTANLYKMKDYVGMALNRKDTQPASNYKRLIRFFQDWGNNKELLENLMRLNLSILRGRGFNTLILDGTSWTIGQTKVQYLVLAVLVGKVAVPIYWEQLKKLGASSQDERESMLQAALQLFDLQGMTLLADREYIGKKWFKLLKDSGLDFVIRLKWTDYLDEVNLLPGRTYEGIYQRCMAKQKPVRKYIVLEDRLYSFVMVPNQRPDAKEDYMIFLTTLSAGRASTELYRLRWKIETLFFHLKTNGYNLEDLNLRDSGKNKLLMAIFAMAYSLAIREGWKRRKRTPVNTYQDGTEYREVSIFRDGLAILTSKCQDFLSFIQYLLSVFSSKNHRFCKNVQ